MSTEDHSCLYSTYKGLKSYTGIRIGELEKSLYSTYKGLKYVPRYPGRESGFLGLYSTYKGLKLWWRSYRDTTNKKSLFYL